MVTAPPAASPAKDAFNATVIQRINITPRLSIFRIRPDEPFSFEAGQFTVLGLPHAAPRLADADPEEIDPLRKDRLIRRAYSISSGSQEREFVEFFISLVGSGQLTPRLFCLKAGDRLFMGTKATGVFTLNQVPADKDLLLIGTGTGLAPYMSMVRSLALGEGCPVRPLSVIHGARYSWDLGYRAELESLARACGGFHYLPAITGRENDYTWSGWTGRIDVILDHPQLPRLIGFKPNPDSCHAFLCGHPGMVENVAAILQKRGFDPGSRKDPGNLHLEKYW
ncbi:MAG: ferredoxin--NADP reductase [Magnetococcales bacterium]|nr:ferredoxin--NADP reductase [Magnetococcales bacterium]